MTLYQNYFFMITVTVKLFALCKEKAGTDKIELVFADGADRQTLVNELNIRFPALVDLLLKTAFAINNKYASGNFKLQDGNEVGLIPPVSGG